MTKYKANRSFVAQTSRMSFSPLEYDLVAGFTSTLFDNYMDYKALIKAVQDMMADPDKYEAANGVPNAVVPTDFNALIAVRAALRTEMNKIVQAVDILTKDPHMLKRSRTQMGESTNDLVKSIISNATGGISKDEQDAFWDWQPQEDPVSEQSPPLWTETQGVVQAARDSENKSLTKGAEAKSTAAKSAAVATSAPVQTSQFKTSLPAKSMHHQQWVYVATGAKKYDPLPQGFQAPINHEKAVLMDAWVESSGRVLDLTKPPPEGSEQGQGDENAAFVETIANAVEGGEGSWELGWVQDAEAPDEAAKKDNAGSVDAPASNSKQNTSVEASSASNASAKPENTPASSHSDISEPITSTDTSAGTGVNTTSGNRVLTRTTARPVPKAKAVTINFDMMVRSCLGFLSPMTDFPERSRPKSGETCFLVP